MIQTTYSKENNNVEFPLEKFELNKIDTSSMEKYFRLIDKVINQLETM